MFKRNTLLWIGLFATLAASSRLPASEAPKAQSGARPQGVRFINSEAAKAAGFPFSQAVQVDRLLFLSGQIGYDPVAGKLVEGGIGPETRQTMDSIKAVLAAEGLGMDSLVKCTAMLADMQEWGAFNEVYRGYFEGGRFPARSALGVNGLALNARVEVECIAVRPD